MSDEDEKPVVVQEAPDIASCGCFAFLGLCVVCATVLMLVWMGRL